MTRQRVKHTRSRKSRIMQLPEPVKTELDLLLREDRVSQIDILDRINAHLASLNEKPISQTSLNRYSRKMARMGQKVSELRAVSEVWVEKLGEAPTGDVGKLLLELVRTLAVEVGMNMMSDDSQVSPEALNDLAQLLLRTEQAATAAINREKEIRQAFAEQAAKEIEQRRGSDGLTEEAITNIKKMILGIA